MTINGVLFFDLDGTLLDANSRVTPSTVTALRHAEESGYLPVIATGRSLSELREDQVFETTGIDSAVILNGMEIYVHQKPIFKNSFMPAEIEVLHALAQSMGHEIGYYSATERFNMGPSADLDAHYAFFHQDPAPTDATAYLTRDITMLLTASSDVTTDDIYRREMPGMQFFRNSPYSMDVTKAGIDKGSGVAQLLAALAIPADVPTYGFGDGGNDLALLNATTHKIAMGNAIPALKEKATFVTKSNVDDGIAYAFKTLGIID
jgi:Cof subfamily protein (haloacid dehalogenase superfamily)